MAGQVRATAAASVIAAPVSVGMLLLFFSGYGSCPQADCDADERGWLLQAGFLGLIAIAAAVYAGVLSRRAARPQPGTRGDPGDQPQF